MTSAELPKEVRDFVTRHITSVEELEVLLLLRAVPDKDWSIDEVRRALSGSSESIRLRMDHLVRHRLVHSNSAGETFRYSVGEAGDATIDEVANAYAKRRVAVIGLIFSGPSDSVRSFSDAFRFRDEDKEH